MRKTDEYHVQCVCGAACVSQQPSGTCAACGRAFRIWWPAAGGGSKPRTISEKYEEKP